jgi:hypothetical protein
MASIYDKALKRKDYSGIVDREKEKDKKGGEAESLNVVEGGDVDSTSRELVLF